MPSQERRGGIEIFGFLSRSLGCTPNNPRCAVELRNGTCGQSWPGAHAPLCRRSVHIVFWLAWCVTTIIVITEQPVNLDGRERPDLPNQRRRAHPQNPPHDHRRPLRLHAASSSPVIASARRAPSNLKENSPLVGKSVSPALVPGYMAENDFRFNERHTPYFIRTVVETRVASYPSGGQFANSLPFIPAPSHRPQIPVVPNQN